VVFSFQRAVAQGSDVATKLASVKEAKIVDDHTVDFITNGPNPIFPHEITTWYIMNAEWAEANGATEPTSVKAGVENFATRHANGTGPFKIVRRVPDVTTVLEPNPDWWGEANHNLTEIIFTPISSDATRVA